MYFTAIEPPGNIQKPFYELQDKLLKSHGIMSAKMLPPLIPISPDKLTETLRDRLFTVFKDILSFQAAPIIKQRETEIFSPVEIIQKSGGLYKWPVRNVQSEDFRVVDLFASAQPVIFLACGPGAILKKDQNVIEKCKLSWKKMYLTEVYLNCRNNSNWWHNVTWEYTQYLKISCG